MGLHDRDYMKSSNNTSFRTSRRKQTSRDESEIINEYLQEVENKKNIKSNHTTELERIKKKIEEKREIKEKEKDEKFKTIVSVIFAIFLIYGLFSLYTTDNSLSKDYVEAFGDK